MRLAFDIEADNLLTKVTKLFCIVAQDVDTGDVYTFTEGEFEKAIELFQKAQLLIAHNGVMYDIPVLQKFYPEFQPDITKVFDTMIVSRLLNPDRDGGHSLKMWGSRLGFPKMEFNDFSEYSEEMLEYCKVDVEITSKLFHFLKVDAREVWSAIITENKFSYLMSLQEQNGFTLDIPKVKKLYEEYKSEADAIKNTLKQLMPPIADKVHYKKVKGLNLLLEENETSYTYITEKTRVVKTKEFKFSEPNPTSRPQIIDYLKTKGWSPQEFTEKGTPKVDDDVLASIKLGEAEGFARLFRLNKLMSMIENKGGGWLNYVTKEGKVHGGIIPIGTATSRCSHSKPNMAQVDKKDKRMREVWIPRKGWKLVGCDASGLELRILAHYLAPYDKGTYAHIVVNSPDIHTENMRRANLRERNEAKTIIYALLYGSGVAALGKAICQSRGLENASIEEMIEYGKEIKNNIYEGFVGLKQLNDDLKKAYDYRGYLKAIDGRPLHVRTGDDGKVKYYTGLNMIFQSAGAIVMKQSLIIFVDLAKEKGYTIDKDYSLVANIHDEFQIECKPEIADELGKLGKEAVKKAGEYYDLAVELDGEYLVGNNWSETH